MIENLTPLVHKRINEKFLSKLQPIKKAWPSSAGQNNILNTKKNLKEASMKGGTGEKI